MHTMQTFIDVGSRAIDLAKELTSDKEYGDSLLFFISEFGYALCDEYSIGLEEISEFLDSMPAHAVLQPKTSSVVDRMAKWLNSNIDGGLDLDTPFDSAEPEHKNEEQIICFAA